MKRHVPSVDSQTQDGEIINEATFRQDAKEVLRPVRILAVSGSLRIASSNTALLWAARALAPEGVEVVLYEGLAGLPHFNPDLDDLDAGIAPPEVVDFRTRLDASDGLIIASPEYAHGVPGAMKNAIDWVVSSGQIYEKPVALLNASVGSTHAYASLKETRRHASVHPRQHRGRVQPLQVYQRLPGLQGCRTSQSGPVPHVAQQ